jgi:hypothetical protein
VVPDPAADAPAPLWLVERSLGHAVTTEVIGNESKFVGERTFVLFLPAEMVLRSAMDEQDRWSVRLAPLAHVQPEAAAAPRRVHLHLPGPLLIWCKPAWPAPMIRVSLWWVVMSRLLLRRFVAHRPHGAPRIHAVMSGE